MNSFSRSFELLKITLSVMKQDKELILFPLVGGIFSILFVVAMVVPSFFYLQTNNLLNILILFSVYFGLSFIATFFNVCVVYTVKKRFDGGNATFFESIQFALTRLSSIVGWALIAASVGLILRLIDHLAERLGDVGELIVKIITSLLGAVWSITTVFVIPGMVYHDIGPVDAFKQSITKLKGTWGENLIRFYGLGIAQFVFIVLGILLGVALVAFPSPSTTITLGLFFLLVIYFILVILFFSLLNSIYSTALYYFAEKGTIPTGFNEEVLRNSFSRK